MDQKAYINAMWIMFPNSTLQKHGTGRSGGPGRDRCDENQPGFIRVAVGIRNPGDCCFDSGPCSAESRLRLETFHRVAATSVTRYLQFNSCEEAARHGPPSELRTPLTAHRRLPLVQAVSGADPV